MDPFHYARRGDSNYFKTVPLDVLLNAKVDMDETLLNIAVMEHQLECCEEICRRCPSLLYYQTLHNGWTALQHAAYRGRPKIMKLLISVGVATDLENEQDIERGGGDKTRPKKHLTIRDFKGESAMHKAVNNHKPEAVKILMEADPDKELLKFADTQNETPLHWAVEKLNLEIVKLMIDADPGYLYNANASGETPLLITMRAGQSQENAIKSGTIRKLLLTMQPNQSQAPTGDNGWTSLHHATYKGDLNIIEDIIRFCPNCWEAVSKEGQNFLHLAAKFEHANVVKYILGTDTIASSVLNVQDNDGNSPLHIAALSGNQSMTLSLLYDIRVNKKTVNHRGQRVLDAINFDYDKRKAGVFGITNRVDQKELKEQSDFDLVVGALIATVSFTAGITVPGGYISEDPNKGTAVLSKQTSFKVFIISNNFALLFSLYAVFSHFCTRRLVKEEEIIYQLNVATFCTLAAIFAMVLAFITGSYAVLDNLDGLAITICVNCCFFFIFALRPMWKMIKQHRSSAP